MKYLLTTLSCIAVASPEAFFLLESHKILISVPFLSLVK